MFKTERIVLSKTKVVEQKNNKNNELLKYRAHFAKNSTMLVFPQLVGPSSKTA